MANYAGCKHEESEVWVSYCSGFTNEVVNVSEVRKCKHCSWTWRMKHSGKYVQESESIKVD